MAINSTQSKAITQLRFPLIVGVVLIHSHFSEIVINGTNIINGHNTPLYEYISFFFSDILARASVPLFYIISGFLFFHNVQAFTKSVYYKKLKSRSRSLLIPYILWNLIVIFLFFFTDLFFPHLLSGNNKPIADYSFQDWIWAFWNTNMITEPATPSTRTSSYPICYQFWFIRDLIVVTILTPLIYFFVKRVKIVGLIIIGVLWLFKIEFNIVGLSITALFFFTIGAYYGIHKKSLLELSSKDFLLSSILYIIFSFIILIFKEEKWCHYLQSINIIISCFFLFNITMYCIKKYNWKSNHFLAESSFFIYAYHAMPLAFILKTFFKYFNIDSDFDTLSMYILAPSITIILGLLIYFIMSKFLPKTTAILTGGRL